MNSLTVRSLWVLCLGLLILTCVGCVIEESVTYYEPHFLPDGRIVAIKHYEKTDRGMAMSSHLLDEKNWLVIITNEPTPSETVVNKNFGVFPFRLSPDGKYITKPDGVYTFPKLELVNRFPVYDSTQWRDQAKYYQLLDWSPSSDFTLLSGHNDKKWMVWDFMNDRQVYLDQRSGVPYCFIDNQTVDFIRHDLQLDESKKNVNGEYPIEFVIDLLSREEKLVDYGRFIRPHRYYAENKIIVFKTDEADGHQYPYIYDMKTRGTEKISGAFNDCAYYEFNGNWVLMGDGGPGLSLARGIELLNISEGERYFIDADNSIEAMPERILDK